MPTTTQTYSLDHLLANLPPTEQEQLKQNQILLTGQQGQYVGWVLAPGSLPVAWSVLTDYNHFSQVLPTVTSSQVVEAEGDRKVVEQVDSRRIMLVEVTSRVCTENIETPQERIDFRLLDGDLKTLEGHWQLHPLECDNEQVLITQTIAAEANAGLFEGAFHSIFKDSLQQNLSAIRDEIERRSQT